MESGKKGIESMTRKKVLIISPQTWGKMLISKHHYAISFAEMGYEVYYMNPPNAIKGLRGYSIDKIPDFDRLNLINYYLLSNRITEYFRIRHDIVNFHDWYLLKLVNRICKEHKLFFDVVLSFEPNLHGLLYRYPARKKIFFTADMISKTVHTRAAKNIDAVVSVGPELLEKFDSINSRQLLVNHGINTEYREFAKKNLAALDNGLYNISKNRVQIGYIGNLLISCLYIEGLKKIVSDNPNIDFHFWGAYDMKNNNVAGDGNEFLQQQISYIRENLKNTYFYGVKSALEIIPNLDKIDAFIYINDSKKDINGGVNSHKILEYLTTGKVIISTWLSYYKDMNLFPMLEKGKESDYPAFLDDVLSKLEYYNDSEMQKKRIKYALSNTYNDNLLKILDFVE